MRKIAKMHFLTLFYKTPKLIEKLKMPRFITSGQTFSPQDQIINDFEILFFIKKIGHFRLFCGVTEPTPLASNQLFYLNFVNFWEWCRQRSRLCNFNRFQKSSRPIWGWGAGAALLAGRGPSQVYRQVRVYRQPGVRYQRAQGQGHVLVFHQ